MTRKNYSLFATLIVLLTCIGCNRAQTIDNKQLTQELDSIMSEDQRYRAQISSVQEKYGWNSPEMSELWAKQKKIDSSNLTRILEVIKAVDDYPGITLVGHSASKATFYVLQHAPDSIQEHYYELIIEAAKRNELDRRLAAMYQDRYLMLRGEPQIFGTQVRTELNTNAQSDERVERTFVWPIADTTRIDSIRRWNGLGPLEEYLNNFGVSRWK